MQGGLVVLVTLGKMDRSLGMQPLSLQPTKERKKLGNDAIPVSDRVSQSRRVVFATSRFFSGRSFSTLCPLLCGFLRSSLRIQSDIQLKQPRPLPN